MIVCICKKKYTRQYILNKSLKKNVRDKRKKNLVL